MFSEKIVSNATFLIIINRALVIHGGKHDEFLTVNFSNNILFATIPRGVFYQSTYDA